MGPLFKNRKPLQKCRGFFVLIDEHFSSAEEEEKLRKEERNKTDRLNEQNTGPLEKHIRDNIKYQIFIPIIYTEIQVELKPSYVKYLFNATKDALQE